MTIYKTSYCRIIPGHKIITLKEIHTKSARFSKHKIYVALYVCQQLLSLGSHNSPIALCLVLSENCDNYGGVCANQSKYRCNVGTFQLLGSNNELLCSAWSSNNERCCMRNDQSAQRTTKATPAVTSKPAVNTGAASMYCITVCSRKWQI